MDRLIDSIALFGVDMGSSTQGNTHCDWCGAKETDRELPGGEPKFDSDSIKYDEFGNKQILECCFGDVEDAVLRSMHLILPWYIKLLETRQQTLNERYGNLRQIKKLLEKLPS